MMIFAHGPSTTATAWRSYFITESDHRRDKDRMGHTSITFRAAHGGGADYDFVVRQLAAIFRAQGIIPPQDCLANQRPVPVRAVGLIFGRPTCKVFKEELLPDRGYH